jgi:single-strand DNA-binding protein
MSFHTIVIVGHLGREPEMRYSPAGQAVTNFNLAANRQFTDSNSQVVKETTWFRVSTRPWNITKGISGGKRIHNQGNPG